MKILIEATNYRDGTQSEYEHQSGLNDIYSTKDPVASILVVWKVTMASFDHYYELATLGATIVLYRINFNFKLEAGQFQVAPSTTSHSTSCHLCPNFEHKDAPSQ